ncbi:MAG: hypothetical protein QOJ00_241 [Actinomycetota bacterium]
MKLAIVSPVVTNVPGAHARWERNATIEDLARVAEAADRLGYHHLTCSEHIAIPSAEAPRRGATYWDPLATFGFLAARTERIRFLTNVLVLGYHHPLEIVKRYGTLDQVSGGRLLLGVGVGSLEDEFDLVGAPFDDRGARADDALRALRASLSSNEPEYHGEYYSFSGFTVDPCALQDRVPIWVGGRTVRSLRRAVEFSDGWCPFMVSPATASEWLARFDVPNDFDVVMPPERPLDPAAEPAACLDALGALRGAGTTTVSARFVHHSLAHYCEQMAALNELNAQL